MVNQIKRPVGCEKPRRWQVVEMAELDATVLGLNEAWVNEEPPKRQSVWKDHSPKNVEPQEYS